MKTKLCRLFFALPALLCFVACKKTGGDEKPDITKNLVGYYAFNSNLLVDSSTQNGGAVNHGAVLTTDHKGKPNNAVLFHDSAYIEIPSTPALNFNGKDFTINAWVNLADTQSTPLLTAIVSKGDSANYIWQFGFSSLNVAGEYGSGQGWIVHFTNLMDPTPLQIGQWYMITMTIAKSAGTATLFVNGAQAASFSEQGIADNDISEGDNNPILIGLERTRHYYLDGAVDDLRMYDRVISQEEITQLYNN